MATIQCNEFYRAFVSKHKAAEEMSARSPSSWNQGTSQGVKEASNLHTSEVGGSGVPLYKNKTLLISPATSFTDSCSFCFPHWGHR